MADALYNGRKIRTLNVIDEGNREALAIDVALSIPSVRVIRVLEELVAVHGRPVALRVDNGPELISEAFMTWCGEQRIEVRHIQPGKPDQNAFIERFNRSYRREVLDAFLFDPRGDVDQDHRRTHRLPRFPRGQQGGHPAQRGAHQDRAPREVGQDAVQIGHEDVDLVVAVRRPPAVPVPA